MIQFRLDSSELFDSASGLFDDETDRFFDSGVTNADLLQQVIMNLQM
jgi:hypothetical protein